MLSIGYDKVDKEETIEVARQLSDFPTKFLNYKDKGYTAELIGNETINNTLTYKIKLTRKHASDNEEAEVQIYYFDVNNYYPIKKEYKDENDYQVIEYRDYKLTNGIAMHFTDDRDWLKYSFEKIEVNSDTDEGQFKFSSIDEETATHNFYKQLNKVENESFLAYHLAEDNEVKLNEADYAELLYGDMKNILVLNESMRTISDSPHDTSNTFNWLKFSGINKSDFLDSRFICKVNEATKNIKPVFTIYSFKSHDETTPYHSVKHFLSNEDSDDTICFKINPLTKE